MYTFLNVNCGSSTQTQWVLLIEKGDTALVEKMYKAVNAKFAAMYGKDPHLFDDKGNAKDFIAALLQPSYLMLLWRLGVEKALKQHGKALINHMGGFFPVEGLVVNAQVSQDSLIFPGTKKDNYDSISIKRWPKGEHFYLTSRMGRLIVPEKHNTFEEAMRVAKLLVDEKHIYDDTDVKEMRQE